MTASLFLSEGVIQLLAEKLNEDCAYEIAKQYMILNLPEIERRTQRFRKKRLHISLQDVAVGFRHYRIISKKIFHDYRLMIEAIRGPVLDKLNDLIDFTTQTALFLDETPQTIERQVNEVVDDYLFKVCTNIWYSHPEWEQYDP